jgi:oxygen-independent coproporphyrinogen-3 oxidase
MQLDLIKRHAGAVPRYTSYPTANHFAADVDASTYRGWLAALPSEADLSLYLHIPYCHELCWYCGCTTKATQKYEPVAAYLKRLLAEIAYVGERTPPGARVRHIHWGGGSPSILAPDDIRRLDAALRASFNLDPAVEYAVEVDPRNIDAGKVAALAGIGVNRISLGVQDFDEKVQVAINRVQSYDLTRDVVEAFRAAGVASINIDLVYGLPHQNRRSVTQTILKVLDLRPDRIAIFGYAHIPSRIKHQRLINDATLPDVVERYGQSQRLARMVRSAGYRHVGLDHFALPSDAMGTGQVRRNFQGYTTDACDALIGLGASAISQLPQGYVQNAVAVHDYAERIAREGMASVRGAVLTCEDRVRAGVIERLMCDFEVSTAELRQTFGVAAETVIDEALALAEADPDGLVEMAGTTLRVTERGRPFVRAICACFDAYLGTSEAKHALAV